MSTWKDRFWAVVFFAVGLAMMYGSWALWKEFQQLESGHVQSMKIWAPLAWIYNIGGIWSLIAKWVSIVFLGLAGLAITVFSVYGFFAESETGTSDTSVTFDARYDLSVTPSQIANEETVVIPAPNGRLSVKLVKTLQDQDYLRLHGEGREGKGDLYVVIQVREA